MFMIQSTDRNSIHYYHLDRNTESRDPKTMKRYYYPYWSKEMHGCEHFETLEEAEQTYNEYPQDRGEGWYVIVVEVVLHPRKNLN